jgi:cytochrome P450 family 135
MMSALPPGPRAPGALQALEYTMRFPQYTARLHARYGPSYTLRLPGLPTTVVTTDRQLIRHVLTGDPLARRHANDILGALLGNASLLLLKPAEHLARRRMMLPTFHGEQMKRFAPLVREIVEAEIESWPVGKPIQVHPHARNLTLAVIQTAVLGSRDPDLARRLGKILDRTASPLAGLALFAPPLQRAARWNPIGTRFQTIRSDLDDLMAELVTATRADPALAERTDLLAQLAQSVDEGGHGLTDRELNDELKTLMIAGHESTATAIAWAADLLAHHPPVAERLRESARNGDDDYVANAAKEVLRIRTVAPVSVSRTLLEGAQTDGCLVPSGTVIVVDAYSLHRDPSLHPDPDAFHPERFANGGPPQYSYLPFGGGAHRCIGAPLAVLELEAFLAAVSQRFELQPVRPPEREVRRGPTLVPAKGATVMARRR